MIKDYLPRYYDGIYEFEKLNNAENALLDVLSGHTEDAKGNQFIVTAQEEGINNFETILGITPNLATETLEERRGRVLNRMSLNALYTTGFFRSRLDDIIGKNQYELQIDYETYTIFIKNASPNQFWYQELYVTLNTVKPANMLFVNMPHNYSFLKLDTKSVTVNQMQHNYTLGSWELGKLPFRTVLKSEVQDVINRKIKQNLLDKVANFITREVASVTINDDIKIENITQNSSGNTVEIEFEVKPSSRVNEITKIHFLDSQDDVLAALTVYIPVLSDVLVRYELTVTEGEKLNDV